MKRWELKTIISSDDALDGVDILRRIDQDANRGDGIYIDVGSEAELVLIEQIPDEIADED